MICCCVAFRAGTTLCCGTVVPLEHFRQSHTLLPCVLAHLVKLDAAHRQFAVIVLLRELFPRNQSVGSRLRGVRGGGMIPVSVADASVVRMTSPPAAPQMLGRSGSPAESTFVRFIGFTQSVWLPAGKIQQGVSSGKCSIEAKGRSYTDRTLPL